MACSVLPVTESGAGASGSGSASGAASCGLLSGSDTVGFPLGVLPRLSVVAVMGIAVSAVQSGGFGVAFSDQCEPAEGFGVARGDEQSPPT